MDNENSTWILLRYRLFFIRKKVEIYFKLFFLFIREKYERSWLQQITFFFCFLLHRYSPKQFKLKNARANFRLLARVTNEWFDVNRWGRLTLQSSWWGKGWFLIKNVLSLGAYRSRLQKTIEYTFLTLSLEIYNPLNRRTLKYFIQRKVALLEKVLNKLNLVNGKRWDPRTAKFHISAFERNSLLQDRIIYQIERAVQKQKIEPFIQEGREAMQKGLIPILVTSGVSGSYWIRGIQRQILGLFKPFDEEPSAPNNPVGPRMQGALGQRRTRLGCRVGELAHHEVAAFLIDHFLGFGIVPHTYYASFTHHIFFSALEDRFEHRSLKTKYGSFQEYIRGFLPFQKANEEERAQIPVEEFQLLVVIDVILGNTDRNGGNILIGEEKIAAIDHGFCLPDVHLDPLTYWYWSYLEQGKRPLFPSLVELVNHFPIDPLTHLLTKRCFISLASMSRMRERLALFAAGVNAGLVPAQLGNLMVEEHLKPLTHLQATLSTAAVEQVQLFLKKS